MDKERCTLGTTYPQTLRQSGKELCRPAGALADCYVSCSEMHCLDLDI